MKTKGLIILSNSLTIRTIRYTAISNYWDRFYATRQYPKTIRAPILSRTFSVTAVMLQHESVLD
jgi:hypothetical protein